MKIKAISILIGMLFCIIQYGIAQNWPMFSGPYGNDIANSNDTVRLLKDYNYAKLLWKSDRFINTTSGFTYRKPCSSMDNGISGGFAGPIVYNDKVYLYWYTPAGEVYDTAIVSYVKEGGCIDKYHCTDGCSEIVMEHFKVVADEHILCLNANTGEELWHKVYKKSALYPGKDAMSNSTTRNTTMCAGNGKVFAGGISGYLYALNAENGQEEWKTEMQHFSTLQDRKNSAISEHKFYELPGDWGASLVYADSIVVAPNYTDGSVTLTGYSVNTGSEVWSVPGSNSGVVSPKLWKNGGNTYVLSYNDNGKAYCMDIKTGEVKWTIEGSDENGQNKFAVNNDYFVFFGTGSHISCYAITPTNYSHKWTFDKSSSSSRSAVAIYNGYVYEYIHNTSQYYCINAETGIAVDSVSINASTRGPMTIYNGYIFNLSGAHGTSTLKVLNADPGHFRKIDQFSRKGFSGVGGPDENPMVQPIVNGKMYTRGNNHVNCYDISYQERILTDFFLKQESYTIHTNNSQKISYFALDQIGRKLETEPSVEWSVSGGGTIDQNGTFHADSTTGGPYYVIAKATQDTVTLIDSAQLYIKKEQTITCHEFDSVYYLHDPFQLQCEASSGLPLHFKKEAPGPYTLNGDTVTLSGIPGKAHISVHQPGNQKYTPAPKKLIKFVISTQEPDDQVNTIKREQQSNPNNLTVYPNPTNGKVYFKNCTEPIRQVSVYDLLGHKKMVKTNVKQIDLSAFPDGIYLLKMNDHMYKIIKQ